MQFNNEENIISWSSPPKKKRSSTGNKWRVPNFGFDLRTQNSRTLKRKSNPRERKFDFSFSPSANILPPHNSEVLSPVLYTKKYENPDKEIYLNESPVLYTRKYHSDSDKLTTSPINQRNVNHIPPQNSEDLSPILNSKSQKKTTEESFLIESPVLYGKRHNSDSEAELDTSPVINRDKNKLIKLGKIRLQIKNTCVRQLTQLKENESEIVNNISKNIENNPSEEKSKTVLVKPQKQIIPVNNNTKHIENKIFKNLAWKFKQDEEKVEIEEIDSQDVSNNTIHINNDTVRTKSFQKLNKQIWKKIAPTEEKVDIELINSQEILPSNFNEFNKTKQNKESKVWKFQPTEETEIELINSQEILTQKSLNIETSQLARNTSEDEKCVIDSVESQISSIVSISSTGTVIQDSLEKSSEEYQLSPRKKKKYKPGTLAYQFHKLLRKQKADVAIWKHELYLTSTSTYQIPATKEDYLITNLKLCKMFVDFGINVWECIQSDLNNEKCLVVANINNLSLKNGDSIKIIPPFFIKYVLVSNINVKTFINVHKIIKL